MSILDSVLLSVILISMIDRIFGRKIEAFFLRMAE